MSVWGKLAGVTAGYLVGGIFGAVVGAVAGHYVLDKNDEDVAYRRSNKCKICKRNWFD